jgi:NTE family protein
MTTRALVLSGGGPVGIAWESGVTIGLAQRGVVLAEADLVVGTSAGSAVGAQIALGRDLDEQVERYRAIDPSQAAERSLLARDAAPERMAQLIEMMTEVMTGDTDSDEARARIGKFALEAQTIPEDDFVAVFGYLAGEEWPRRFACTAVDAETGALVVWDGGNRAPLERAVASSCAVPGLAPPITIDGRRYVDGGMRSPTNADLAEGNDRVLLLSLIPPTLPDVDDPRAARFGQRLADELATITDAGGVVEIVTPDDEAQAVMGVNLMDPTVNLPAAEAGIRQGRAIAEALAGFWVA